jgi:hypothetical protein
MVTDCPAHIEEGVMVIVGFVIISIFNVAFEAHCPAFGVNV